MSFKIVINRRLLPLKILYFAFCGGFGCLWPFLNIHIKQLGMSIEQAAIINTVCSFVAVPITIFSAILIDKLNAYRLTFAVVTILSALFFNMLLLVPPTINRKEVPLSLFSCGTEGAYIQAHGCKGDCHPITKTNGLSIATLSNCSLTCNSSNKHSHLCISNKEGPEEICRQMLHENYELSFVPPPEPVRPFSNSSCTHNLSNVKSGDLIYDLLYCQLPSKDCRLECHISSPGSSTMTCDERSENADLTFWLYLVLRLCGDAMMTQAYTLVDSINIAICDSVGGDVGRSHAFGHLATAIFGTLLGFWADRIRDDRRVSLTPFFFATDALVVISVIMLCFLKVDVKQKRKEKDHSLCVDLGKLVKNVPIFILFLTATISGIMYGYFKLYNMWYLTDLGAPKLLLGLTLAASLLPGIPLIFYSKTIINKLEHANVIVISFLAYTARSVGYAFITNPWFFLPLEGLEALCTGLPRVAISTYAYNLAPRSLLATTQTLIALLYYGLGRGVGTLVGGYVVGALSARTAYLAASVLSCVSGAFLLVIHNLWIKHQARRKLDENFGVELQTMTRDPAPVDPLLARKPEGDEKRGNQDT